MNVNDMTTIDQDLPDIMMSVDPLTEITITGAEVLPIMEDDPHIGEFIKGFYNLNEFLL